MHAASAAYDRRRVWPESHDTELAGTAVKAVVDELRMPPQSMLQRMRDKAPFALGKSSKDDGRLEQLQMLALKPETLWNTMQVYNETRIIVAALMMGLSLTLLFGARPTDGGAWWSPSTMHWLGSVTDWISMLAFFMYFYQLMVSFSSSRVYATVPPHRLHEFIAEVTAMNPRPDLNREDTQNLGFFVMHRGGRALRCRLGGILCAHDLRPLVAHAHPVERRVGSPSKALRSGAHAQAHRALRGRARR
jgi:hypothetical protein